jgi:hypothetical protein
MAKQAFMRTMVVKMLSDPRHPPEQMGYARSPLKIAHRFGGELYVELEPGGEFASFATP